MNYDYERKTIATGDCAGTFDLAHPERTDKNGEPLWLAHEIEAALPGVRFIVRCDGEQCRLECERQLDAAERALVDAAIAGHRAGGQRLDFAVR
jgi:hypothetical protein